MPPEYQELEEKSTVHLEQESLFFRWPDFATVMAMLLTIFLISQKRVGPAWTVGYLTLLCHLWALPGIWLYLFFRGSFLFSFILGVYFMYQTTPSQLTLVICLLAVLWCGVVATRNYYLSLRDPSYRAR